MAAGLARERGRRGHGRWVVVHGGGGAISAWQERLGLPVERRDGLRVTTSEGLEVTSMVLSGWVNKRLVACLLDHGVRAVGISGEDGGLLRAELRAGGSYGAVGRVTSVDSAPIRALLDRGFVPVVSPLTRGPEGAPLNVNADEAAEALASALGADELYFLSDVPGVLSDAGALKRLSECEARKLRARGTLRGGMAVKVASALRSARGKGMNVRIGNLDLLDSRDAGTRVGEECEGGKGADGA